MPPRAGHMVGLLMISMSFRKGNWKEIERCPFARRNARVLRSKSDLIVVNASSDLANQYLLKKIKREKG